MKLLFWKKNTYENFEKWLNRTLSQSLPPQIVAFHFNLYQDGPFHWSVELIGTPDFDANAEDWTYSYVFSNRKDPFFWKEKIDWTAVLEEVKGLVQCYLQKGKYAPLLKSKKGIGMGFLDGDVHLLYQKSGRRK